MQSPLSVLHFSFLQKFIVTENVVLYILLDCVRLCIYYM